MTNFVKQQNLQTKIKMNIWTFWMYYIYLLQKGDIKENQYKMLDDTITEYLRKTTDLNN
jgi:catalase